MGEFVAVGVLGSGDWLPERVWRPGESLLVNPDLNAAAGAARASFGSSRALAGGRGSLTAFVRRAPA